MRISKVYKLIFVHVPKTAGNSISAAIDQLPNSQAIRHCDDLGEYRSKHAKASELKRCFGDQTWANFLTFACVRNPWDQMVSSYFWWLQKAEKWPENRVAVDKIRQSGGFEGFLRLPYGRNMINEFSGNADDWISDDMGNLLVDIVVRFENLEREWESICSLISCPYSRLPLRNKSVRGHYREYYSPETRSIVSERFKKTIDRFEYTF